MKVNYALRPAKNMERKMFCEALARLSRIAGLATYRYVGFGAIGFHDFCLFHKRLGIRDMVSLEGNLTEQDRVEENKPYSCIRMKWGMSHELLQYFRWPKRAIVWLDYETPIDENKLFDIATVCGSLRSGSALIVTLPADPGPVEKGADTGEKRLSDLRSRVGKKRMPAEVTGDQLAKWGLATVLRRIVVNVIDATLADRSAPFGGTAKLRFDQLFNFHYADGVKMLSVGGLIVDGVDREKLGPRHFQDLTFYRNGEEPYLIETPLLTSREIKFFDERLPRAAPEVAYPSWIPESERKKYGKVYRYFPSFSEVEN